MGDKEFLADSLSSQKLTTSSYNTYAGECACDKLRSCMINILKEEHDIQNEIFVEMQSRGWYPTKPAPQNEINDARMKYQQAT